MFAKLIATLAERSSAATILFVPRSPLTPRWIARTRILPPRSVFGGDAPHLHQHVMHGRLTLRHVVRHRGQRLLHLRDILWPEAMDNAAHCGPVLFELLREIDLPGLRLRLDF